MLRAMVGMLLVTLLTAQPGSPVERTLRDEGYVLEAIGAGVWAAIAVPVEKGGPLGNAGIIDLGGKAVVVDAGASPRHGRALLAAAKALTGAPVVLVVSSHGHDDHTGGNEGFGPEVSILGSMAARGQIRDEWPPDLAGARKEAAKRLEQARNERVAARARGDRFAEDEAFLWQTAFQTAVTNERRAPRLPDIIVDERLTLVGARRRVEVQAVGAAHTPGDLVVVVPDAGALFAGDLVFSGIHPYLADGSVAGLRTAWARLRSLAPTAVVPGHGPVAGPEVIDEQERYLAAIETVAAQTKAHGGAVSDASVPPAYASWHLRRFFFANIAFLVGPPTKP